MATEILPWSLPQVCFTVLRNCLRLYFWPIAEMLRCAGALRLDNRKVFRCPGCKVSLVFFCFMNKYDSRLLKCLFLSRSPIASSCVCWGVHNCLWCVEVTQVSYFVLYVSSPCLVGLAAEINKTVKTIKQKTFTVAKRIFWCIYNGTTEY